MGRTRDFYYDESTTPAVDRLRGKFIIYPVQSLSNHKQINSQESFEVSKGITKRTRKRKNNLRKNGK